MKTLTIKDLEELEQEGWIQIIKIDRGYIRIKRGRPGKSGPTVSISIEKTDMARRKPAQWRKITGRLKEAGFVHIGGGNGWYGCQKNDKWCTRAWDMIDL